MHALLMLAAEGAETSKTAFYVAGGALTAFAILVSVLGMTKPDFPSSENAGRATAGLAFVLVVATMASVIATA